jgi:uncharacterized protein YjaZ
MRLKTDRRGGVAFPGSEGVFIVAPLSYETMDSLRAHC